MSRVLGPEANPISARSRAPFSRSGRPRVVGASAKLQTVSAVCLADLANAAQAPVCDGGDSRGQYLALRRDAGPTGGECNGR